MVDLETGRPIPWKKRVAGGDTALMDWPDQPLRFWLETEGAEKRLVIERAGENPSVVRSWSGVNVAVDPSPDRQRLLVSVGQVVTSGGGIARGEPGTGDPSLPRLGLSRREQWVYEISSDRWIELPHWNLADFAPGDPFHNPPSPLPPRAYGREWVGPHALARVGRGLLGFEDVDSPGKVRYVFGPGS
jgi:hypothetical protein